MSIETFQHEEPSPDMMAQKEKWEKFTLTGGADGREVADNSKFQQPEKPESIRPLGHAFQDKISAWTEADHRDANRLLAWVDKSDSTWPPIASVDTKSTQARVNVGWTEWWQYHEVQSA